MQHRRKIIMQVLLSMYATVLNSICIGVPRVLQECTEQPAGTSCGEAGGRRLVEDIQPTRDPYRQHRN